MKKIFTIVLSLLFISNVSASSDFEMNITSDKYEINNKENIVLSINANNDLEFNSGDYILLDYNYFEFDSFEGIENVSFKDNKIIFDEDITVTADTVIGTLTLLSNEVETNKDIDFTYSFYQNDKLIFSDSFELNIATEEYTPVVEEEETTITEENKKNIWPFVIGGTITISAIAILLLVIKKFIK